MRTGEAGKKVVQCDFVRCVDHGDLRAQNVGIFFPKAVSAESEIDNVTRHNAGGIRVGTISSRRDDVNKRGPITRGTAGSQKRLVDCGKQIAVVQADFLLLVTGSGRRRCVVRNAHHDKSAVKPPSNA